MIISLGLLLLLGVAALRKLNLIRLLAPRFLLGLIIGWPALVTSKDLWALSHPDVRGLLILIGLTVFSLFTLFTKISNRLGDWGKSILRALSLFVLGVLQSFVIGFWFSTLILEPDQLYPPLRLLFSTESDFRDLQEEFAKLQKEFANHGITLDKDAHITHQHDGTWLNNKYVAMTKDATSKLNIYRYEKYWSEGGVNALYHSQYFNQTIHFYHFCSQRLFMPCSRA
ncbi:hypothetical protein HYR99_36985 [Candidatus Poribacteria bacterium]|nr:hypothetical protein [Candidatus Poribacteria bacterium]